MSRGTSLFARIYFKLALLQIIAGAILRVVLLFNEQTTETGFSFAEWAKIFLLGAMNDWCAVTVGFAVLWIFAITIVDRKYAKPFGWILFGLLTAIWCYVTFFNTVFDEYGSVVPLIASLLLGYWALGFGLRLFVGGIRHRWTGVWFAILITLYVGGIIFNAVSEWFFWSEFGVRYNFIAVDYLVYTNEVVGNIMESYPIVPLALTLVLATLGVTWYLFRHDIVASDALRERRWKLVCSPAYLVVALFCLWLLPASAALQNSDNVYVNELQATGAYKFYDAFVKNELDYTRFYLTLPGDEAETTVRAIYGSTEDNLRTERSVTPERRPNIVLITIESMSASFMEHFGGNEQITPCLDSLYGKGISFERLFATGNRTVRGLEAVTLCLPPCPGQSLIKRENNAGLHSTGSMLREKGYTTIYFYGGNSYFDNMESFFGGNGYEIVDKKSYSPDEITFANIWGVCDEDAFDKVLRTLDERDGNDSSPFFAHVMTVSNHRPYTYPAGRISIPNDSKQRSGGVMYSDYALGRFLREARKHPWFDRTVFVITADHCASSAGKTEIPLEKYHIPGLIYAPSMFAPASVDHVVSQIDLMPTLFSLLGMEYPSRFFGRNALADDYTPRAFIATYQDLGYLERDTLTVLSPVCRVEQYAVAPTDTDPFNLAVVEQEPSAELVHRAIGFYQASSAWNAR